MLAPTQQELIIQRSSGNLDSLLIEKVKGISEQLNFFHWELAFPHIFTSDKPGFDCILWNPPWERKKLQEEEFFAAYDPEITKAPTKAVRKNLINQLPQTNPSLAQKFEDAKHVAECTSKFTRNSIRYPLTAIGDINTYALFAEQARICINDFGVSGLILPTGIVTDDTTKVFLSDLVDTSNLSNVIGFENEAFIFPAIHHSTKFCCFFMQKRFNKDKPIKFVFFCRIFDYLKQDIRHFQLTSLEFIIKGNKLWQI